MFILNLYTGSNLPRIGNYDSFKKKKGNCAFLNRSEFRVHFPSIDDAKGLHLRVLSRHYTRYAN